MVEANEPTGAAQTGGVRAPLLARQRAIVTGRRGGIGSGVARGLRAKGATIVGIGRSDPDGVLEPAGPLRGAVVADLARRDECARAFHTIARSAPSTYSLLRTGTYDQDLRPKSTPMTGT